MTEDKHFKRAVRSRAQATGEPYAAARAALRPSMPQGGQVTGPMDVEHFAERFDDLVEAVALGLVGNRDAVELTIRAVLAGSLVLFDGPPGVGQTALTRALATAVGGRPVVIDGAADLAVEDLPGLTEHDVILVNYPERLRSATRSALLPRPPAVTCVLAKSQPGSEPGLPLEVRDRFNASTTVGYADAATEAALLETIRSGEGPPLRQVIDLSELARLRALAASIECPPAVRDQAIAVVRATREDPAVRVGASMNAILALVSLAAVTAAASARSEIRSADIAGVMDAALGHRIELHQADDRDAVFHRAAAAGGLDLPGSTK